MSGKPDSQEHRPGRQRPGNSCMECRTKKLKCDGRLPRCTKCQSSGSECTPATQAPRGPKKGHLRVLQSRIDCLEQQVVQLQRDRSEIDSIELGADPPLGPLANDLFELHDLCPPPPPFSSDDPLLGSVTVPPGPVTPAATTDLRMSPVSALSGSDSLDLLGGCIAPGDPASIDLNHLYFERVQPSFPFLHRRRYYAWTDAPMKTPAQSCLQYAMWAVAASLEPQWLEMREILYQSAMQGLDTIESKPDAFANIEHVQASFLLCIYEMMRNNFRRGFLSAGRLFRLIQLTCLHEIDSLGNSAQRKASPSCESWLQLEEKRRTFWMAYVLDLTNSVWGYWRPTLHEQPIYTLLPMPEDNFQNEQYLEMPCLHDPMQDLPASQRSSATDCILMATVCHRVSMHQHRCLMDRIGPGAEHQTIWAWHEQLEEFLQRHVGPLMHHHSTSLEHVDSMFLFASTMSHALFLCLCEVLESTVGTNSEFQMGVGAFRQRSVQIARQIAAVTKILPSLDSSKAHPLLPLPLCICAEFFERQCRFDTRLDSHTQEMFEALHEIGCVNKLAHEYLIGQRNRHSRNR